MIGDAFCGCMGPVGSTKCIIDKNIAEFGQLGGEFRVIFRLLIGVSEIFQQKNIACVESINGAFNGGPDAVVNKSHFFAEQSVENRYTGL